MARAIVTLLTLTAALCLPACKTTTQSDSDRTGGGGTASGEEDPGETGEAGGTQPAPAAHTPDPEAVAAIDEARVHFEELAYTEALAKVEVAIGIDARYDQAYLVQGQVLHANSDYTAANASFTRALELSPKLVKAWESRGLSRYWNGDLDGAIADFSEALELDDALFSAYSSRGTARAEKLDYEGALTDLRRALELLPEGGDEDSLRGLIERAEELQRDQIEKQRRGERMEALTGEDDAGDDPESGDDDPDANDG